MVRWDNSYDEDLKNVVVRQLEMRFPRHANAR